MSSSTERRHSEPEIACSFSSTASSSKTTYTPPHKRSSSQGLLPTPSKEALLKTLPSWRQSSPPSSTRHTRSNSAPELHSPFKTTSANNGSNNKAATAFSWRSSSNCPAPITPALPPFADLLPGQIFYLARPNQSSILHAQIAGTSQTPWDHAAMVIKKISHGSEPTVQIVLCTSFAGQHIHQARKPWDHEQYMLAANHEDEIPHGDTYLAEMVQGSAKFSKRTYVAMQQRFEVEYEYLRVYGNSKSVMRFDARAVQRIRDRDACEELG